jgi:hypothetical protein
MKPLPHNIETITWKPNLGKKYNKVNKCGTSIEDTLPVLQNVGVSSREVVPFTSAPHLLKSLTQSLQVKTTVSK